MKPRPTPPVIDRIDATLAAVQRPEPTVAQLHRGYLMAARELGVGQARALEILDALPDGFPRGRYQRALRLLAGEAVDDMAAATQGFGPSPVPPEPHWARRLAAAVARQLLRPFRGTR